MAQHSTGSPSVLLIAETRPLVATGLATLLADCPGMKPVTIMTGFDDVVDYAERHDVGLIIVGEGMNGEDSLRQFGRLREKNPAWRLALLVDAATPGTIRAGLSAGASGIISGAVDERELEIAVTRILAGDIHIPNMTTWVAEQPLMKLPRAITAPSGSLLTPRQIEVLGVLAQGKSNRQIAEILDISDSTVSMHLNAAFQALGVRNRTSAALAYRNIESSDWSLLAASGDLAH